MKNRRLPSTLLVLSAIALVLAGCTTVRKGANTVADGAGRVVEGTGNVVRGVGNVIGGLAPKRQTDDPEIVPELAEEEPAPVAVPEPVVAQVETEPETPPLAETVREEPRRGNVITRGVGGVLGSFAPKKQQVELGEDEDADGEVVEVLVDGEVRRFESRRPSINPFNTYPFKPLPQLEGDATTNQILRAQAWARVVEFTEVRLIGDDRVRIDVTSPLIMEVEEMEYLLLARAAGEASRAGFPRFSIVYLNYKGGNGLSSLFLPDINIAGSSWIGAYEDLITERENQRLTGNINTVGAKEVEAVVLFLPAEDRRRRATFAATETYLNMLNTGLFDGQYPYAN